MFMNVITKLNIMTINGKYESRLLFLKFSCPIILASKAATDYALVVFKKLLLKRVLQLLLFCRATPD